MPTWILFLDFIWDLYCAAWTIIRASIQHCSFSKITWLLLCIFPHIILYLVCFSVFFRVFWFVWLFFCFCMIVVIIDLDFIQGLYWSYKLILNGLIVLPGNIAYSFVGAFLLCIFFLFLSIVVGWIVSSLPKMSAF